MRLTLPPSAPGMRIGLYGGSFNPAHRGHRHVTVTALRRLGLDRVWWLVSPGNPLKSRIALPSVEARCAQAQDIARHPRIAVTGIEAALGVRFTIQTLRYLTRRCPGVHFVWVMGADSLGNFHRWKGFTEIARLVPIAIIDRPGFTMTPLSARAAHRLAQARVPEAAARTLALRPAPAWMFLHGPRSRLSSTEIRDGRGGGQEGTNATRLQSRPDTANFIPVREPRSGGATSRGIRTLPETIRTETIRTSAPLPEEPGMARSDDLKALALFCLDEMKAEETIAIDLAGKTSLADTMIITSGRSQRHVGSIADKFIQEMKTRGFGNARVEGMPACDWVLIDAGDVLVHIFRPEVRGFYNLEKMWGADRPIGLAAD